MNEQDRDAKPKIILLLIDPQLDFHDTWDKLAVRKETATQSWMTDLAPDTDGSLPVTGSAEDSVAISEMIHTHIHDIHEIYVTLDTHHVNHIGHAAFWFKTGLKGESEEPIAMVDKIRHADIVGKKYQPKDQSLMDHVLHYSQQLENKGNFTEMQIWPEHCLIGTTGHAVVENVNYALQAWSEHHMKVISSCGVVR